MGQYWQVASPEQEEQLRTSGKLGEILPGGFAGRDLEQRLMVPLYKQRELLTKLLAKTPTERDEDAAAVEEDLKTVFNEFCRRVWLEKTNISLGDYFDEKNIPSLIQLLFDRLLGAWANRRIVCVGDYSDELPPGYHHSSNSLYNSNYKETLSLTDFAKALLQNFESYCPRKAQFFQEEYSQLFEEFFPSNQQYVLLNLTSREYVVGRGLWGKELKKAYDGKNHGLGDAAMTGICWSQDPSTSMESRCIDTEGKWAGHRFIIISQSVFEEVTGREGWKDVSENVNKVSY